MLYFLYFCIVRHLKDKFLDYCKTLKLNTYEKLTIMITGLFFVILVAFGSHVIRMNISI